MSDQPRLPALGLAEARALAEAVLAAGRERGFPPLAAAVVDLVGEIQALLRADGAAPLTSRMAAGKARTAVRALMSSGDTEGLPEGIRAAAQATYGGEFVSRAGGLLVVRDQMVLGGLGASGAASEDDEAAARAALDGWTSD